MSIRLDFTKLNIGLVVIGRKKNKIVYNSGVQNFSDYNMGKRFIDKLKHNLRQNNPDWKLRYYIVSNREPFPPMEEHKVPKGSIYCPYCGQTNKLKVHRKIGCKKCPICGISDVEFYVRFYNKMGKKKGEK